MSEAPRFHDESLMPLTMGSPYRVPYYAYPNWGLTYTGEEQALAAYKAEWASGGQDQMDLVEEASNKALLNGYPELLRTNTAIAVDSITRHRSYPERDIKVLVVGTGPGRDALEIHKRLSPEARQRVVMFLLDPSSDSLKAAGKLMAEHNIRYEILTGTDSEVLPKLNEGFVDILTADASIHHHSKIPFEQHLRVLKSGGSAIYADWHQPIWEHPGNVLRFLKAFNEAEWPRREEGLKHWVEIYPQALDAPALPDNTRDRKAMDQIINFWKAYARIVRERGVSNGLWPLEGHRPSYAAELRNAGFKIEEPWDHEAAYLPYNPYRIIDSTSLLQLTAAQKVA